ncbi:MAG TPA: class I SAM-dependent methyltransferase [Terriglobia bacterium]|jgi:2-polyprenyl-3-methyl-5-hydroxy-6-metoxy-1,4-benzoquinol methylase
MPANSEEQAADCDLCGTKNPRFVLNSPGLDGPLVECVSCGFRYVGLRRSNLVFGADSGSVTTQRVIQANESFRQLSGTEEHRLGRLNAQWRLDLMQQFKSGGKLLEVGCARGDFLDVASKSFNVFGVEPNPDLAADSRRIAPLFEGVIERVPWKDFDVAASFHVIEHVDSPRRFIQAMAERLKPGGLLVIETPNIASLPFTLLKSRWRQFIPEHYFFFDPKTISRLFKDHGLEVRRVKNIGKHASAGLVLNRLSRYCRWLPQTNGSSSLTFRINPMDIMLVFATKKPA